MSPLNCETRLLSVSSPFSASRNATEINESEMDTEIGTAARESGMYAEIIILKSLGIEISIMKAASLLREHWKEKPL